MAQDEFHIEEQTEPFLESDRRRLRRQHCEGSPWLRFPDLRTARIYRAMIRDFSALDLGIVVDCYVSPGTNLIIEVQPKQSRSTLSIISAIVRQCTPTDSGDWVLGCTLPRALSNVELSMLGIVSHPAISSSCKL